MLCVTVLTGGSTPERDVALAGAAEVVHALRQRGYQVSVMDLASGPLSPEAETDLLRPTIARLPPTLTHLAVLRTREDWLQLMREPAICKADIIFPVLHGREVEGGLLQAVLEVAGGRFVGSDLRGSLLAMDKDLSKQLFLAADIPTAPWARWPVSEAELQRLGLPLVVKPARAGSTIGLSVVRTPAELHPAVERARSVDPEVLLERFIAGRELTVGVLGDQALAVGEIIPQHEIFDYECKYTPGMSQEIFPAEIDRDLTNDIRMLALRVHRLLKLRHFSRIDFRLGEDGVCYCLEANTLPGLTRTSLVPQSAAAMGMPFDVFCDRLCRLALEV
jgi:D-alanine-D-alanine ligase